MTDRPDLPLFSPAFAGHFQQAPPEFLYHYTDQTGLLGIIESRSLWATNISYMNDATEFGLSVGLIRDRLLAELETKIEPERSPETDAGHLNERQNRARELLKYTPSEALSPINVICFCEKGDLLSQWRGYAGAGYGYSLAFYSYKLKTIDPKGFILGKCIYDPALQNKIVAESVEYLLSKETFEELSTLEDLWSVFTYGAFFKHPSFEEEQEWRLVSTLVYIPLFRKGKSMIIPYSPLPLTSDDEIALGHAFVGPCPHMELSRRSVGNMLRISYIDVEVYPSAIPFRDW